VSRKNTELKLPNLSRHISICNSAIPVPRQRHHLLVFPGCHCDINSLTHGGSDPRPPQEPVLPKEVLPANRGMDFRGVQHFFESHGELSLIRKVPARICDQYPEDNLKRFNQQSNTSSRLRSLPIFVKKHSLTDPDFRLLLSMRFSACRPTSKHGD
jgi:hypothetical protein